MIIESDKVNPVEEESLTQVNGSRFLTRADILAMAANPKWVIEEHEPPGWPGVVRIKELSAAERGTFEAYVSGQEREINGKVTTVKIELEEARALMAQMCIVNEYGELLFSKEDIGILSSMPARALDYIFDVARRLSGMDDDAAKNAKKK